MAEVDIGQYTKASQRFRDEFIPAHKGIVFTSRDVLSFFRVDRLTDPVMVKRAFGRVLYELSHSKEPRLEQTGKQYRVIDRTLKIIEWHKALRNDTLEIKWPYDHEEQTNFGFDESIKIYPGDLIVVAGEGNKGKTTFALNFVVENMDIYPCFYFTSEFNASKFTDRMASFNWVNIFKKDGTPKFILAEQDQNWQDIIQPNAINVVDWVYLEDDAWKMRGVMRNIIKNVGRGIALVVIQKRSYKQVGEGGEGTMDLASVYLTIRYDEKLGSNVLRVNKVKSPKNIDPNYQQFTFKIVQNGAKFHDIQELK